MLIPALGRETLPASSSGVWCLPPNLVKIIFCARWGTTNYFASILYTINSLTSSDMSFKRSPPHITGRSVSTVRQVPNELATFRFHDSVVDFVERSFHHMRSRRVKSKISWEFLEQLLPKIAARNQFFLKNCQVPKTDTGINIKS